MNNKSLPNNKSLLNVIGATGDQTLTCDECGRKAKQVVSITLSGVSVTGLPWDEPEGDREAHLCGHCLGLAYRSIVYPATGPTDTDEGFTFCPGWRDPYDYNNQTGTEPIC